MTDPTREAVEALAEKSWYEDAHGEAVLLSDATDALETLAAHPTPPPPLDALRLAEAIQTADTSGIEGMGHEDGWRAYAERLAAAYDALPPAATPSPDAAFTDGPTGEDRRPAWMIHFEDPDHQTEVFSGEGAGDAARRRFEQARQTWNCTLFRQYAPMGWASPDARGASPSPDAGEEHCCNDPAHMSPEYLAALESPESGT